ncbi:DUF4153 domain-containing protein [Cohnella suwonensis]|uniref:DUF4153 domain-containing protein n=1 Tax=Cohnella suwonensis TaxID=696072 RepID=A0ABW0M205_9BACL
MVPKGEGGIAKGRATIALAGAFALAVAHQYLFYGHLFGVSYPIFMLLLYAYMFHDRRSHWREETGFGWFLFVVVLLLSLTYALFDNPVFQALDLFAIPSLFFLHLAYSRGAGKADWWDIRLLEDALQHFVARSLRHVPTSFKIMKFMTTRRRKASGNKTALKVLAGLALSLPLLFVVVTLLASADGVFEKALSAVPSWWSRLPVGETFARLVWIFVAGILFFCYLWGFVKPGIRKTTVPETEAEDEDSRTDGLRADPIIMATLLVSVNAVYVLFVVIQFTYLFGAWQGDLPDGKTYAEYARSGFLELVAVTLINFALLMFALTTGGGKQAEGRLRRAISSLLYVLVGCSGVMLYSAYSRLILYEDVYGYTYIRFLVHAFMIYLAILLIIAAIRIRTDIIPLAKCYIVVSLAAYVLVNYVGMDRIIAEKNIERYRESGTIDPSYLSELSLDAVPTLAKFAKREYPSLQPLLENKRDVLSGSGRGWQSFNWARHAAERELDRLFDK